MTTKTSSSCSDRRGGRLIVLEGMPGAGKTTTVRALADLGRHVLGEYTSNTAATIPVGRHPAVGDDQAHQANWLRKAEQASRLLAGARETAQVVYADRDWLNALAYAYSIADTDAGDLLTERIRWANKHIDAGHLLIADVYVLFDLDPATSLRRRAATARPEHPWSHPTPLQRLRAFYLDPARVIRADCPDLAEHLDATRRVDLSGTDTLARILTAVQALGEVP